MLKLEATLVAMTAARPWRCGWSLDRGVDFIAPDSSRRIIVPAMAGPAGGVAGENRCFLDGDDTLPIGTSVARPYVSLAAQAASGAANGAANTPPDPPLARAWSSLARKVPGS